MADPMLLLYNARDVSRTDALYTPLLMDVVEAGAGRAYSEISQGMLKATIEMTLRGVGMSAKRRGELHATYSDRVQAANDKLKALGITQNPDSPQQLADLLFRQWGFSPKSYTERGHPSVNEDTLLQLTQENPGDERFQALLNARHERNMLSTYIEGPRMGPDGRIHPVWRSWGTVSWRLASREPNLQNIPRDEPDVMLRSLYCADPGNVLVHVDFSQVEFRWQAYLSGDVLMISRFENYDRAKKEFAELKRKTKDPTLIANAARDLKRMDPHVINAAAMWRVPADDVDEAMRFRAKIFVYGLMYGGSPEAIMARGGRGLSRDTANLENLQEMSKRFFDTYPIWTTWRRLYAMQARLSGKVVNAITGAPRIWFGRRTSAIEREAQDYAGQGHAAAVMNRAHLRIEKRLTVEGIKPGVILQIHDALIAECPERQRDLVHGIMVEEMQTPVEFEGRNIVFPTGSKFGTNWLDASND